MMSNPQNSEKSEWPPTTVCGVPRQLFGGMAGGLPRFVAHLEPREVGVNPTEPWNHGTSFPVLGSDKLTFCYGKSPFLTSKSTISMAMFNSYVYLPEGNPELNIGFPLRDDHILWRLKLSDVWRRICHPEEQLDGILMIIDDGIFARPLLLDTIYMPLTVSSFHPLTLSTMFIEKSVPRDPMFYHGLSCFIIMFPVIRAIQGYIPHWSTLIWTKQILPLWDESQIRWVTRVSVSLNEDDDDIPKIWFTLKYHHLPIC